ncbi:hypothetical protein F5880DRAFT_1630408 [Lentinula raphanica]|nr:hypothetical protein F5880DRAFT_1630408 [Lentinula raphanica]
MATAVRVEPTAPLPHDLVLLRVVIREDVGRNPPPFGRRRVVIVRVLMDAQKPVEDGKKGKRALERGFTAVGEMEHIVKDFLKEVGKEASSVPSLILLDEFDEGSHANRGLQNDMTGGLLCPAEIDWDNTDVRAAVQRMDPEFDFASSARSRCFYKDEKYNPYSPDEGYLQSYLLLQVYRTIYTSPFSAKDQPEDVENLPPAKKNKAANSHRAHVANIIQLSQVTPRSLAYAAVHLHLALTDASQWRECYDGYNYRDLWNFIVDLFEDPADDEAAKQAKELLKWWTDRIFTGTGSAANSRGTKMVSRRQAVAKNV